MPAFCCKHETGTQSQDWMLYSTGLSDPCRLLVFLAGHIDIRSIEHLDIIPPGNEYYGMQKLAYMAIIGMGDVAPILM